MLFGHVICAIRLSKQYTVPLVIGDLMQLVNDKVNLYMPIKGIERYANGGILKSKRKTWSLSERVIDYKALVGDSSDNYPGVQGIGKALEQLNLSTNLEALKDIVKKSGGKRGCYRGL